MDSSPAKSDLMPVVVERAPNFEHRQVVVERPLQIVLCRDGLIAAGCMDDRVESVFDLRATVSFHPGHIGSKNT